MAPEPPAKITLYHNERTRSQVVYWYEESTLGSMTNEITQLSIPDYTILI